MGDFQYPADQCDTFDSYQEASAGGMSLEEANLIFREYHDSIDLSDPDLQEEYSGLVSDAVKYACFRLRWAGMTMEEKRDADEERTDRHNRFLNDIARYAGYLQRTGKDYGWFQKLCPGSEPNADAIGKMRKRVGDWACFIAMFIALNNR